MTILTDLYSAYNVELYAKVKKTYKVNRDWKKARRNHDRLARTIFPPTAKRLVRLQRIFRLNNEL